MATMDLPVLSRLLGHASMAMVATTYVHLLSAHVKAKMDTFDAAMPALPTALQNVVPLGISHLPSHLAVVGEKTESGNCYNE
jgi:hypothetical protein